MSQWYVGIFRGGAEWERLFLSCPSSGNAASTREFEPVRAGSVVPSRRKERRLGQPLSWWRTYGPAPSGNIVAIVSGGNIDLDKFAQLVSPPSDFRLIQR